MSAFQFAALDIKGKHQRGVLEADSSRQVRQLLRDRGWMPLSVDEARQKKGKKRRFRRGLKQQELALFTRQLATLVRSSMPLEESLNAVAQQNESNRVRTVLLEVRSRVMEGYSLAAAMEEHPLAFPDIYRAMVSAGEHSGHLDGVLERLAEYSEGTESANRKIKLAMIYPAMLILVSLMIVIGLMTFVVPQVVGVFTDQGQELPWLTQTLITTSDFLTNHGLLLLGGVIATIFIVRWALKQPGIRLVFDKKMLELPIIRRVSRSFNSARFSSTLGILTGSGVPLVEGLKISQEVVANTWLQNGLEEVRQNVSEGVSMKNSLTECGYFSPLMVHMVGSGEASGQLSSMLMHAADNEQRNLDAMVDTTLKLMEPLILLAMGGAVFTIVLAILQPIFELNQLL